MISSYVSWPDGRDAFYLEYGFTKTGLLRNHHQEIEDWFRSKPVLNDRKWLLADIQRVTPERPLYPRKQTLVAEN